MPDERRRTIFRIAKNKDNPYVMMDKRPLEDKRLSWKSKGILGYLLSRPDGWEIQIADLIARSLDGGSAVRSALAELKQVGYLRYLGRQKSDKGRFERAVWEVYEIPYIDFPHMENPNEENRQLSNIENTVRNESSKKNSQRKSAAAPDPDQGDGTFSYRWPKDLNALGPAFEIILHRAALSQAEFVFWMNGSKTGGHGLRHYLKAGISVSEMNVAAEQMSKSRLTIKSPASLWAFAWEIHAKGKHRGQQPGPRSGESTQEYQARRRAEEAGNEQFE